MGRKTVSMELIIILVIAVIIFAMLLLIALCRMCCSLLAVYSEYRKTADQEEEACTTESGRSRFSSTVKSEKLALIESCARLERETGIRIQDYPFTVDYNKPLLISANTAVGAVGLVGSALCNRDNESTTSSSNDSSQELGSDSPGSTSPFLDSRVSTMSEDEEFQSISPQTEDYSSAVLDDYPVSPGYSTDQSASQPSPPTSPSVIPPTRNTDATTTYQPQHTTDHVLSMNIETS